MEPTPFDRGIRRPDSSPRRQQRQGQLWEPFPPLFVPRRAAGLSPSLLPHPGGLEGLLPRLAEGDAGDTPVAERPHQAPRAWTSIPWRPRRRFVTGVIT